MSNEKFSQLPTVTSATTSDIICAVQGGISSQETLLQVLNLVSSNIIQSYSGNPNGNISGTIYNLCWDISDSTLWICTASGSSSTAIWTKIANSAVNLNGSTGTGSFVGSNSATLVTPNLGSANASSITFNTTSGIIGTTTNNNASTGSVGEFISNNVTFGSATNINNGVATDLTSISLTAGDWDVSGNISFNPSASLSQTICWISILSATNPDISMRSEFSGTISSIIGMNAPILRVSVSSTTTVYITGFVTISSGTCTQCGGIYARRIR